MLQPRDAVESLAQKISRDNEQQRSQHRPLRGAACEADILRHHIVHLHLRRAPAEGPRSTPKERSSLTMQPRSAKSKERAQSMGTASVLPPPFLHRIAPVTCMSVSSVDRAGLNPACCGRFLSSMQSLTQRVTMRSISLHSALVSVAGRKDAMLLAGLFGCSSGTMMPCRHLAGTWPVRKLQLNTRKMHLLATLPSCFSSSQWISSSPGAVPEDNSRSATSSNVSVMGWNVHRLVLGIFISGACGDFFDLAHVHLGPMLASVGAWSADGHPHQYRRRQRPRCAHRLHQIPARPIRG
ncbi:hypothetical protein TRVL_05815 [Trypanosoma vivax]|nr:hypothetical protein TRVL_05815 [Trypanosoma vivax]